MSVLCKAISNSRLNARIRYSAREYGYADHIADIRDVGVLGPLGFKNGSTAKEGEILADDHSCFFKQFPDWDLTTGSREDLVSWLASRGVRTGFFFPDAKPSSEPEFLDHKNPRYAPKLAAAVRAWQAVVEPGKKTPKQMLEKWLRENAAKFGLTDDDGNPVNQAIEECAKVANWSTAGGAPKTPSE